MEKDKSEFVLSAEIAAGIVYLNAGAITHRGMKSHAGCREVKGNCRVSTFL